MIPPLSTQYAQIRKATLCLSMALVLATVVGCGDEQESLHEHDHFVPAHWPSDLQRASQLILERLPRATEDATARKELLDLMSWVPEIAADTPLGEPEWNPIFAQCEQYRKRLLRGYDAALGTELQELAATLTTTHAELKKLQPRSLPFGAESPAEMAVDTAMDSVEVDAAAGTDNTADESDEAKSAEIPNEP